MYRKRLFTFAATALSLGVLACGGSDVPPPEGQAGAAPAEEQVAEAPSFVAVGEPAPDFELPAATRFGVLDDPVSLSDFRGKTVVLAFFFRARGRG